MQCNLQKVLTKYFQECTLIKNTEREPKYINTLNVKSKREEEDNNENTKRKPITTKQRNESSTKLLNRRYSCKKNRDLYNKICSFVSGEVQKLSDSKESSKEDLTKYDMYYHYMPENDDCVYMEIQFRKVGKPIVDYPIYNIFEGERRIVDVLHQVLS